MISFFKFANYLTLEFLGITLRLVQTIGNANAGLNMLVNTSVHIEKFIEFENNKLNINSNYYKVDQNLEHAVSVTNLDFQYFNSEDYIFKNINLKIQKGKHTVITGPNGSGKSTFLGLLSQIYYPQTGEIEIFTKKIGYVGVTPLILDGTLKENLIYGNETLDVEDNDLLEMLKLFRLFDDDNYDLNLIISNRTLSSGQMQKISFIRSLLSNTELLLLDESTSNLDTQTRELIFNVLKSKNITIINSTHNHEEFEYDHHIKIQYDNDKRIFKNLR